MQGNLKERKSDKCVINIYFKPTFQMTLVKFIIIKRNINLIIKIIHTYVCKYLIIYIYIYMYKYTR